MRYGAAADHHFPFENTYCEMNKIKTPEGESEELGIFFDERDSDNKDGNVENEVTASLLDLAGIGQSI